MLEKYLKRAEFSSYDDFREQFPDPGTRELQFRLRRDGRAGAKDSRRPGPGLVRRAGRQGDLHLRPAQGAQRSGGQLLRRRRHRQGRPGHAHPQAPLRVLVLHPRPAQARRHRDPGDAPAHDQGHRLPEQVRRHQDDRHGATTSWSCPTSTRRSRRRPPSWPRRRWASAAGWLEFTAGLEAASPTFARPTGESGLAQRRHHAHLLHFRHDGHAQDGAARLHLSPRPHPHREILAAGAQGRAPPHRLRHRLGQGDVGQDLRPVALRVRGLRLRLRPLRAQGPPRR